MGKEKLTRDIFVCDCCGRRDSSYSGECLLCKKEYCWTCNYRGYNPTNITLCKDHTNKAEIINIFNSFSKEYSLLDEKIKNSLKKKGEQQ